jgi:hypothetical protein
VPLGATVEGANVPDQKLVAATLDAIPISRLEQLSSTQLSKILVTNAAIALALFN